MANLAPYQVAILIAALAFGVFFVAAGIAILRGKGWDRIPGHKALPPEVRDSPKEARFCRRAGFFLLLVGLLDVATMVANLLGSVAVGDWGMRLILALFLLYFFVNWKRLTQKPGS